MGDGARRGTEIAATATVGSAPEQKSGTPGRQLVPKMAAHRWPGWDLGRQRSTLCYSSCDLAPNSSCSRLIHLFLLVDLAALALPPS